MALHPHDSPEPTPASKERSVSELACPPPKDADLESQVGLGAGNGTHLSKKSSFKSLALLDRFLAVWILLAMAIGIILGNFVPSTGPALQKGKFVGVSIPIGTVLTNFWLQQSFTDICYLHSNRIACHDVPNLV